jgi:hypothetical protein
MATEEPAVPPSTPVTTGTVTPLQDLRSKMNEVLNQIERAAPAGARALAAVRCGGGCHQGVID